MQILLGDILFANPALAVGALALGVPLLIHLLTRRTPKNMTFPSLRFLLAARAHQSRLYHLRHILLMLVRTALLLLILLVFLRPSLMQGSGRKQDPGAGRTTMILMDVSASMEYRYAGVTPRAQAKAAASALLDHCGKADRFNLILMGATPNSSFDEPSDNLFLLRRDIRNASVRQECPNIGAAVAEAASQLKSASGSRHICFISDFQRANWSSVDFSRIETGVDLVFVPVGPERAENCAVTDVAVRPGSPSVSENIEIVCRVANFSDRPRRLPVEMRFQEGESFKQELELEPQSTVSTSFHLRFHQSGRYQGRVRIPEDGLEIDNQRCFILPVEEKIGVLLVTDEDMAGEQGGARFLVNAINPFKEARQAAAVATVIPSRQVSTAVLSAAQVVVLSDIQELSRACGLALLEYLGNGGSVVYFHVGPTGSQNLDRLAAWSQGSLTLPFKLTGQIDLSRQDGHASLAQGNFDSDILRKFRETPELGEIRFQRFFSTERVKQKGQVLLQYDDGNIAMAQTIVGGGTLLLCNFSCSLRHSDLARHTLFVPLIHEIVKGLRPSAGRRNAFLVGEPCFTTIAPAADGDTVVFKDPAGETIEGNLDKGQGGTAVFFPKTRACGFYQVHVAGRVAGAVAVNVDPLESNLERLDTAQLKALAGKSPSATFLASADAAEIGALLEGRPLWHYLLLAAIAMLCLEQLLTMLLRQ
ncbi:MAG: BatA and WFA domain-containing protein [Sedimentisphaerales bacterium]|nr:BatA and WFA domain-containing protein [Sedimentisphaerales bacterium]